MHEKDLLANKIFIPILESILTETTKQRKQLAEQFGKDGLDISGPHARAIIDLELAQLKKFLDSKLEIDLDVYFKGKPPHSRQDESFLAQNIEDLYEKRKPVSIRSLDDYLKQRGFPNVTSVLSRFEADANKILIDIKRKIEIIILQNKISESALPILALPQMDIISIIKKGECQQIELKSSLRWDLKKQCKNESLQMEVLKTICAFNNTDGGHLIIGVTDDKSIFGIEKDYSTFSKNQNSDTFLQTITNLIKDHLSKEFASKPEITVENHNEHDLCKIKVETGSDPIWLKYGGKESFYIRTQAGEQELSPREAANYIRRKWPIITDQTGKSIF